jgi:thiosulfate dehydrogenase
MIKNIFILFISLSAIVLIGLFAKLTAPLAEIEVETVENKIHHFERVMNGEKIQFDLLDPEMAPPNIRDQVMRGYTLILHTNKALPEYVDDRLTCANCHFSAGNTLGGKRGGISLVGVVRTYPRYSARLEKMIDLTDRINNCFERSMNGKAVPRGSADMLAIIAYLDWIASQIPERKTYPWLGLELLKTTHEPDAKNGAKVYQKHCSTCHMINGQGTDNNPPVWGPHAFNDGAGMSTLPMLSSFIFYNMPYEDPFLTEEQALDVAAYLVNQRRPIFIDDQKSKSRN